MDSNSPADPVDVSWVVRDEVHEVEDDKVIEVDTVEDCCCC